MGIRASSIKNLTRFKVVKLKKKKFLLPPSVNFSCFFPSRTITNVEALVPTLAQETVGGAWPAQPYLEP